MSTSFTKVEINQSIVDERYPSSSHSLTETHFSTINLSISFCDPFKENEVLNLGNQANSKPINETCPNLLF